MPACPSCHQQVAQGASNCPHCNAPMTGMLNSVSDELIANVMALLAEGRKLDAVKLYKENTGASLLDAKNAVESIEIGGTVPEPKQYHDKDDLEERIVRLLESGEKIEAVKLYKDTMSVGLKDAKEAVERIGERHGIVDRGGGAWGFCFRRAWRSLDTGKK